MRIVQILPQLNDGGVERGTMESSRIYSQDGHESIVISAGGKLVTTIESDGGQHIHLDVCNKNPFTFLWRAYQLRRTLKRLHPDVVHIRSRVPGWLFRWANRTLRIPTVTTLHGLNSVNGYSKIMVNYDRVICVSKKGIQYIKQHYQTPDEKIRLIHRGIDPKTFDPATLDCSFQETFLQTFNLTGRTLITMVGRISELKGCDVLIKALAELKDAYPHLTVLLVGGIQRGQEAYGERLHALVAEHKLTDRVIFAGSQNHVAELYDLSTIICSCNTKKPESFGRSVAEAIAMNRPVIAAAHGGVLEIIKDGKTGIFVPPGDTHALAEAIKVALERPWEGLREDILENFILQRMVDATLAVYQEVIAEQTQHRPNAT